MKNIHVVSTLFLLVFAVLVASFAKPATSNFVTINFLFKEGCVYCDYARQDLEYAAKDFGGRVKIIELNEKDRKTSEFIASQYAGYKERGLFNSAFPTMVATGSRGENSLVGMRSAEEVKLWLCQQFVFEPETCKPPRQAGMDSIFLGNTEVSRHVCSLYDPAPDFCSK